MKPSLHLHDVLNRRRFDVVEKWYDPTIDDLSHPDFNRDPLPLNGLWGEENRNFITFPNCSFDGVGDRCPPLDVSIVNEDFRSNLLVLELLLQNMSDPLVVGRMTEENSVARFYRTSRR